MTDKVLLGALVGCSNDAFDAETGVDAGKAESVVNLLRGNRRGVLAAANACLLGGAALLSRAIASAVRALCTSACRLCYAPYIKDPCAIHQRTPGSCRHRHRCTSMHARLRLQTRT